jgi:hypothetical protein
LVAVALVPNIAAVAAAALWANIAKHHPVGKSEVAISKVVYHGASQCLVVVGTNASCKCLLVHLHFCLHLVFLAEAEQLESG